MNNPKYDIYITYYRKHAVGQTHSIIGGITYSVPTYDNDYYLADMPTLSINATGSSYTEALDNLLLIATASTTIDLSIAPYKSNW